MRGSDALRTIEDAISDVQGDVRGVNSQISSAENHLDENIRAQRDIYLQLAEFHLEDLDLESVSGTITELRGEIKQLYSDKQEHIATVDQAIGSNEEARATLETELASATQALEDITQAQSETIETISLELKENQDYLGFDADLTELQEKVKFFEGELERAIADRDDKVPEYEDHTLFSYLLKRGYDPSVPKKGFSARRDQFVAKVVKYDEQKMDYDFLQAMPGHIESELEALREEESAVHEKMTVIEVAAADKHGLASIEDTKTARSLYRNRLMAELSSKTDTYATLRSERAELRSDKGQYHSEAISKLVEFFEGRSIEQLMERAQSTQGSKDNRLVSELSDLTVDLADYQGQIERLETQQGTLSKSLKGLKRIKDDFVRKDYESSRSRFRDYSENSLADLLTGYVLGSHSRKHVWGKIDQDQYFKPKPRPTYTPTYSSSDDNDSFGGFGSSGGFGGFSSGGSSGGGFSSGGGGFSSGGGGGFSTGGGGW